MLHHSCIQVEAKSYIELIKAFRAVPWKSFRRAARRTSNSAQRMDWTMEYSLNLSESGAYRSTSLHHFDKWNPLSLSPRGSWSTCFLLLLLSAYSCLFVGLFSFPSCVNFGFFSILSVCSTFCGSPFLHLSPCYAANQCDKCRLDRLDMCKVRPDTSVCCSGLSQVSLVLLHFLRCRPLRTSPAIRPPEESKIQTIQDSTHKT